MNTPLHDVYGMVLAAGFGTRLGHLSDERPKPLLPVCDVPLVRWVAELLVTAGIEHIGVNLHHLGERLRATLGDAISIERADRHASITYSVEAEILGTGGGIRELARHPAAAGKTIVVANGKIVANLDLPRIIAEHRQRRALATLVLAPHKNARAWGAIGVDGDGRVARMLDRSPTPDTARSLRDPTLAEHMFTGVHVIEPELLATLPQDGACCILRDGYMPAFMSGAPIYAHVHRGYFYEHSTPERYLQGNLNLLAGQIELPAAPGPLCGVHPSAEVAPSAQLVEPVLVAAGATIEAGAQLGSNVIVGANARIGANARLRETVIWPEAAVAADAELQRAIVTPQQTINVPPCADPWDRPRPRSQTPEPAAS
jgi:mannose-1-phosphate guanylyltransferase